MSETENLSVKATQAVAELIIEICEEQKGTQKDPEVLKHIPSLVACLFN